MKKRILTFAKVIIIISFYSSCSNSKFAHLIGPDKKELVANQKIFSECSDNDKLIGCWTTGPEKIMPDGKTIGERQIESTEILIFFKDKTFASTSIVGSGLSQDSNPYVSYMYNYSVSNGIIKYKNRDGQETSKPIKINENTLEFWDHTYIRGNCSE